VTLEVEWARMTGPELRTLAAKPKSLAIFPVGSLEQHGPHLPVITDTASAHAAAVRAARLVDRPFKGNPAGVCILDAQLSDETMLHIAQELNLSETAFIRPLDASGTFSIRYFSPKMEIPLCGHATLASGKAVFAAYGLGEVHFITIRNIDLAVRISKNRISMVFPVYDTRPAEAPPALLAALGLKAIRNAEYNGETKILLLEIASAHDVSSLNPNFVALYRSHDSINGVLVTAASGTDGYDFHSRYFWPLARHKRRPSDRRHPHVSQL